MVSVLLALGASISWGVSDFLGGLNSRRLAVLVVLLITQSVGMCLLLPAAALHGGPFPGPTAVAFAAAGSASGLIGISGLYRGMAVGAIGIVAPISATGAALPVLVGLVRGERATGVQMFGILLALVGILLASRPSQEPHTPRRRRIASGAGFGAIGALGFGGFFVLLHEASAVDVLWAAAIQRITGVCIVLVLLLVTRTAISFGRSHVPGLALIGILDSTANVLYAYSSITGLLGLAAVLASLFPVVTVLLARVVLRERLSATQGTGVAFALAGVACIAVR